MLGHRHRSRPLKPSLSPRAERVSLGIVAGIWIASRFPDLGRQSPWVDELANWEKALFQRAAAFDGHPLTTFSQRLFLHFDERSVFWLRFPSALGWMLATTLFWWLLRRVLGARPALLGAALMTGSPIALAHAQDANHYHWVVLASILSLWGVHALQSIRHAWIALLSSTTLFATAGLLYFGHPLSGLSMAAMAPAAAVVAWRRFRSHFGAWTRAVPLPVIATAMAMATVGALLKVNSGGTLLRAPYPGSFHWEPGYLARIAADLFSAYRWQGTVDCVIGVLALVLAFAGFAVGVRWPRMRPFAYGAVFAFMVHFVFIGLFDYNHFVYSRYFIGLLPVAVVGVCGLWRWTLASRRHVFGKWRVRSLAAMLAFPAIVVWIMHAVVYYGGSYMDYAGTMKVLGENLGPKDVVVTYKVYHSRALAFWQRHVAEPSSKAASIHVTPLEYSFSDAPMTMLQQMIALARRVQAQGGDLYYFHYIDGEEISGQGYYEAALESRTAMAFKAPSTAQSDIVPIRRDLMVRRFHRGAGYPDFDVFLPSARFPAQLARVVVANGGAVLMDFGGTIAYDAPKGPAAFAVTSLAGPGTTSKVLLSSDGGPVAVARIGGLRGEPMEGVLELPAAMQTDGFQLHAVPNAAAGSLPGLLLTAPDAAAELPRLSLGKLREVTRFDIPAALASIPLERQAPMLIARIEHRDTTPGERLLCLRVHPQGLNDLNLRWIVKDEAGNTRSFPFIAAETYSSAPLWIAIPAPSGPFTSELRLVEGYSLSPRVGPLEVGPLLLMEIESAR